MQVRYVYATRKSQGAAERTLESLFAEGEISPGERPEIERRGKRWAITLPDSATL